MTMTPARQNSARHRAAWLLSSPRSLLDRVKALDSRDLVFAAIAVAVTWAPPAVLSALHGGTEFLSFLTDYASQSRFLMILPVLILAAPGVNKRLGRVAHHLEGFVTEHQLSRFQDSWASFERLGNSRVVQAVIVLFTYALAIWLGQYISRGADALVPWWTGGGGFRWYSPAGTWTLFISYPILTYFTLLWLWRQLLWTRFMRSTAHLNLRLIAAHPDCLGGIGFLESALRGQRPFSFCMGAGLAGAVANRMFHHGQKLTSFSHVAAVLVAAVLLVCVAPYFVFTPALMHMRRYGLLKYGSFARTAGEHFEKKWLNDTENLNQDVLMAADFSAMHNLYEVAKNVNDVQTLPVSRVDLYALVIVAFIPAIPLVLGAIPLDVVAKAAMKLLF